MRANENAPTALRFPPFGRRVAAVLASPDLQNFSGCTPSCATIWLVTGPGGWDWQQYHPNHLAVVLPTGEHPAAFRWDFLRGHDPILLTGEAIQNTERRREIAAALFRDGARRVLAGTILMTAALAGSPS